MKKTLIASALALVVGLSSAIAQQKTGPNGGMLEGKGAHMAELVVSPSEITVYLIDDGKVDATTRAKVQAVIQDAGKATTVELANVENKRLVGKLAAPLSKGAIVVLSGKDDHGHTVAARFVIR